MVDQGPDVHIVIPNYNGKRFLEACLRAIERQTYPAWQVSVIDNGSSDGSCDFIEARFPQVRCIALPENRGFSAAVNAGIQASRADYVFLLNNDTELPDECLAELVEAAETQREFDFFAPKMLSFHKRTVLDGAGDGFLRGGAGYRLGTMEQDSPRYGQAGPVFGACAGAVLYRKEVFARVGLFDEDFFAYLEDVDLNLRMNRAGIRGYYVPNAVVYHIGSATTGSKINHLTVRLSTRNSFFVLLKNYPLSLFIRLLPVICIYQCCWLLFALKKGQLRAYCRGLVEAGRMAAGMRKKYHADRAARCLDVAAFAACLQRAEQQVVASIMHRRASSGKGNGLLRLYGFLFL